MTLPKPDKSFLGAEAFKKVLKFSINCTRQSGGNRRALTFTQSRASATLTRLHIAGSPAFSALFCAYCVIRSWMVYNLVAMNLSEDNSLCWDARITSRHEAVRCQGERSVTLLHSEDMLLYKARMGKDGCLGRDEPQGKNSGGYAATVRLSQESQELI